MLRKQPIDYCNSNPFKNATVLSARHAGATCPTAPHIWIKISRHGKDLSSFFFLSFLPQSQPQGQTRGLFCQPFIFLEHKGPGPAWLDLDDEGDKWQQINNDTCCSLSRDGFCGTRDNDLDASVCVCSLISLPRFTWGIYRYIDRY